MFSSYNIDLVSSNHIISGVQELNDPVFFKVYLSIFYIIPYTNNIQSKRENPHVDYPDFSIIQTFLKSQFCHEYLLVMIKIRSHILFKTTALKSEVKASLFRFQNVKAALARVVTNEVHFSSSSVLIFSSIKTPIIWTISSSLDESGAQVSINRIKDAMVVFFSYNIDLVSSNQII